MNVFKKIYCRAYQICLRMLLPFLPYKNPRILHSLEDVSKEAIKLKLVKPLIVCDQNIIKFGLMDNLLKDLTKQNINYVLYSKVVPNPTTDNVDEALKLYKDNGCDYLIAFGGGSVLDCAKAVGALIARPKKTLRELKGILKVRHKIPTLFAIPSTAGTGSETTLAAVIVDSVTRHKYAINDFPLIPSYAVLDEEVTKTLPPFVAATTGLDALTHAIEAYIGRSTTKSTRSDALEAIKLIFENLENAALNNDAEARKNMLYASHIAGRAFSKSYVGNVHALAHALGGKYNTPHGYANAVILPFVLKEYGKCIYKKAYRISLYAGLINKDATYEEGFDALLDKITNLEKALSIDTKIKDIKEEDIHQMAEYAYHEANPLYPVPKIFDVKKFEEMFYKIKQ